MSEIASKNRHLPVVVIGAGPVGLAAAAHLLERGLQPLVLEAGPTVGAAVAQWAHVRLFSPWRYAIDPAAARLLAGTGWISPSRGAPYRGRPDHPVPAAAGRHRSAGPGHSPQY